jgi:hypothetical protein
MMKFHGDIYLFLLLDFYIDFVIIVLFTFFYTGTNKRFLFAVWVFFLIFNKKKGPLGASCCCEMTEETAKTAAALSVLLGSVGK